LGRAGVPPYLSPSLHMNVSCGRYGVEVGLST
jgi:hypothetical protein